MSPWRQLRRGLRALTDRAAADLDVADEVQHFLDQATAAQVARGLPEAEARRAARVELGSATSVRQQVREAAWESVVEAFVADLRFAARRLRAEPGFTAVAVVTLALGIGATTAIFSAVYPILFAPPPYRDAGRILMIWESPHNPVTFGNVSELAEHGHSFDAIAAMKRWQPTMIGDAEPERLEGQRVGASYFRVLGVAPALGRSFTPADDRLGGPNVVLLGDALWRRRFGGDRGVVGRLVTLDGESYEIIGVLPREFENVLAPGAEAWAPLQYDLAQSRAFGHHLRAMGRLGPGAGVAQAAGEVEALTRELARRHPEAYDPKATSLVVPLHDDLTRGVRPALLAILGAVSLVLVIACVNVANLLLARGMRRRGEFALRAALGAGRGRLIRQLLTESLFLAAMGGAAGLLVARFGVGVLVALGPPGLPRAGAIGVDPTVFAFGVGSTALVGLAFGMMPALQAAKRDPPAELQQISRRTAGGSRKTRGALVVAEIALALVLLVASGLLLRSLTRLFAVEAGFDASHLLTMQVQTSGHRFDGDGATVRFFGRALDAVREVPGVAAAALTSQLPLSGDLDEYGAHFEAGGALPAAGGSVFRYAVSPGYFETMRIALRSGRFLDERDRAGAPRAVVISESLAKRRFGAASPLGERLRIGPNDAAPYTIVGVAGDVRQMSLALAASDAVYTTAEQWEFRDDAMSIVVRTRGRLDSAALTPAIRRAVWSVDKDQPIVRVATMEELLAGSAAERRFALVLFEAFALVALALAAAGIYGALAGSVAERTRELGVRAALGATRGGIVALVLGQGLRLTGLGVAIGLAGAIAASRLLVAMLFGVSRLDPVTYCGVVLLLGGVALVACGIPAWRAARVDPANTLRAE